MGGVAQLGERRVRNAKVGSSILLLSTTIFYIDYSAQRMSENMMQVKKVPCLRLYIACMLFLLKGGHL
jgi:hypothetical protein